MQFWNTVTKVLSLVNSFIVLAALSVYHFGLYQLVLASIALADSLTAGLLDDIVVTDTARGLAEGQAGRAKRLFNQFAAFKIAMGGAFALAFFFGAGYVAAYYGNDIAFFVRLASVLILFEVVRATEDLFFTATVSFSGFATQAVQECVKLIMLGGFLAWGAIGVSEALIATVAGAALASGYSSVFFWREYRRRFGEVHAATGRLLLEAFQRYGWLISIRYAASRLTKNIRPWLIKFFLSTEAVAYYALAINLVTLAQGIFPINMVGRLFPWEIGNERRLRFIASRSMKYALWLGILMAVGAFFLVPPLVTAVFPKYAPAMPLFRAFLLILPFFGIYKIQKALLLALRAQDILTARLVTEAFLVAGMNAVLLPLIGIFGVAVEYTATYAWRVFLFHRMMGRAYPALKMNVSQWFRFDADDRAIIAKAGGEALGALRRIFAV